MNGCVTLQDFADNANDEGSNVSDGNFALDEEYRNEMLDETKLETQEGIVGNNDPDLQDDYFQNPIQQHDANVRENNEPESIILGADTKRTRNPTVALSNSVTHNTQECERRKKKNTVHINAQDTMIENELDDDHITVNNDKPGVDQSR
jgi:hypothetical protein